MAHLLLWGQSVVDTIAGAGIDVARYGWKKAAKRLDTKTQRVSGYTRANGTEVESYLRRPAGNAAEAAVARDTAEMLDKVGKLVFGLGLLMDGGLAFVDELSHDQTDPAGLRVEKAFVAGAAHATIVAIFTVGFVAAVGAIPIVGETGVAEMAAGTLGGFLGGQLADAVVTPSTVDAMTNDINSVGIFVGSVSSSIGGAFADFTW